MKDFMNVAVGDKIWTQSGSADVVRVTRTQFVAVTREYGSKRRFRKADGRAVDGYGCFASEWTEKMEHIFNLEKIVKASSQKVYSCNIYYRSGIDKAISTFTEDINVLKVAIDALRELREYIDGGENKK